jgi:hypothetical protein
VNNSHPNMIFPAAWQSSFFDKHVGPPNDLGTMNQNHHHNLHHHQQQQQPQPQPQAQPQPVKT